MNTQKFPSSQDTFKPYLLEDFKTLSLTSISDKARAIQLLLQVVQYNPSNLKERNFAQVDLETAKVYAERIPKNDDSQLIYPVVVDKLLSQLRSQY